MGSAVQYPEFCGRQPQSSERIATISRPRGIPSYRRHKSSNQAIVTFTAPSGQRRDVYLGTYGTTGSRKEYARVISEWESTGWSSPRKVDTRLRVIRTAHTPLERRTPATSDGVGHCRTLRCIQRSLPEFPLAWQSRRRGSVPSSTIRQIAGSIGFLLCDGDSRGGNADAGRNPPTGRPGARVVGITFQGPPMLSGTRR